MPKPVEVAVVAEPRTSRATSSMNALGQWTRLSEPVDHLGDAASRRRAEREDVMAPDAEAATTIRA